MGESRTDSSLGAARKTRHGRARPGPGSTAPPRPGFRLFWAPRDRPNRPGWRSASAVTPVDAADAFASAPRGGPTSAASVPENSFQCSTIPSQESGSRFIRNAWRLAHSATARVHPRCPRSRVRSRPHGGPLQHFRAFEPGAARFRGGPVHAAQEQVEMGRHQAAGVDLEASIAGATCAQRHERAPVAVRLEQCPAWPART